MPARSAPLRRRPPERLAGWLVTGPLGHLWSATADLACFVLRTGLAGARARVRARDVLRTGLAGARARARRGVARGAGRSSTRR